MSKYQKIYDIFEKIYGIESASRYKSELLKALDEFHPPELDQTGTELSERDSILITYGDAIRSEARTPLQTLKVFLEGYVGDAISTVHLLPFFPYSSDDGFSVIDFEYVDSELGTWADVDALAETYDLMFDAAINHISVQSQWFQEFLAGNPKYEDYFISVDEEKDIRNVFRPRALPLLTAFHTEKGIKRVWTTFSEDQVDLNYHNPKVLIDIVRILLEFVKHGARFIRLDAIAYIWKEPGTSCIHLENAHRIVQFFRAIFDNLAPYVKIITETNVPHSENISYFGDGTNEAQLVYNFSLPPLVLYAFHTQNANILSRWAESLETPSDKTHFFNFLASHDGIGVTPAKGIISDKAIQELCARVEALGGYVSYKDNSDGSRSPYELNINYLDALGDPAVSDEPIATIADRFLASQAIMMALKGIPGIYYHSLLGSRGWQEGVEITRRNRTINREKLNLNQVKRELDNPRALRHQVFYGYLDMLRARSDHANKVFTPQGRQRILDLDHRMVSILRESPNMRTAVLCLINVSLDKLTLELNHEYLKHFWRLDEIILLRNASLTAGQAGGRAEIGPYGVLWLSLIKP